MPLPNWLLFSSVPEDWPLTESRYKSLLLVFISATKGPFHELDHLQVNLESLGEVLKSDGSPNVFLF